MQKLATSSRSMGSISVAISQIERKQQRDHSQMPGSAFVASASTRFRRKIVGSGSARSPMRSRPSTLATVRMSTHRRKVSTRSRKSERCRHSFQPSLAVSGVIVIDACGSVLHPRQALRRERYGLRDASDPGRDASLAVRADRRLLNDHLRRLAAEQRLVASVTSEVVQAATWVAQSQR